MKTKIYPVLNSVLLAFICLGLALPTKANIYTFNQVLTGSQEVPPNASPGSALIVGKYDDATNMLSYGFGFKNLTSGTTDGHFHAPALPGQVAPPVVPFTGMPLGVTEGVYANVAVITDAQEAQLLAGLWYANIHTAMYPAGELRAQIILNPVGANVYPFISLYSGTQEVPPNNSPATGAIIGMYDANTNMITYADGFQNLTSGTTDAHFHAPAPPGVAAGVVIPKTGFPLGVTKGTYINSHILTDAQEKQLLSGLWYSNIHTSTFPAGEIRAQIFIPAPPTFIKDQTIVLNTSCFANDGNISIIPITGVAPFMYSIDGGATYVPGPAAGYTFNNLGVGTYQLRLKDSQGNESEIVTKTIVQEYGNPPTFLNNLQIVLDASCNMNDGNISIIPTGGAAPFLYSIDGGATYVSGPDAGYTFNNLAPGTYQLRLKSVNGCESEVVTRTVGTSCQTLVSAKTDAVSEEAPVANKLGFTAYPNPSRGQFTIQLGKLLASKAEVSVFDSKGTLIQKRAVNAKDRNTINFDLVGSAPGMYYIKVVSNQGTSTSKVLVQP